MRGGRAFMVVGAILALVAIELLYSGGAIVWAYYTRRNAEGFFDSPTHQIAADAYALATSGLDLSSHPGEC
ncbi:MAG: hypothetical protein U9Q94_08715 [Candidatus Bipolaricaulota bacterium]|nr:hypothetical protein [Candidatus Bipolaricaulota bacterium]